MCKRVLTSMLFALPLLSLPAGAGTLDLGDPAPALTLTQWVKGQPVDLAAQKGKGVVVIEFWATWCGPCVASIPDLTKLQREYGPKGVTVIGVTKHDDGNTLAMVEKFVREQGDKMAYTVAFEDAPESHSSDDEKEKKKPSTEPAEEAAETPTTYQSYMKAAGQIGIPTAFVIDRSGRIAWIGHPMVGLHDVIDEIVAGTYDIELTKKIRTIKERLRDPEHADDQQWRIKQANEWIALRPQDSAPYLVKFRAHAGELKQPKEAQAALEVAIELAADKPKVLARIASELVYEMHEHAFDTVALDTIEKAYRKDSTSPEIIIARFEVLASANKETEALAWAEDAVKSLKQDPRSLRRFAMALASPKRVERCNSLAIRTVNLAIQAEPENAAHLQAKFHIQAVCQKNRKAAEETGRYLIEKAGDDASLLNKFAWNLLTEEDTKGKFVELALATAQRCDRVSESKNWMFVDTLALATFESGAVKEAIRLQKKAIELCESDLYMSELSETLKRFEGGKKK